MPAAWPLMPAAPSVFFYCAAAGPSDRALYQHGVVALAEGLRTLGVPFVGSTDYWRSTPSDPASLVRAAPPGAADDHSIVVVSESWCADGRGLPPDLFHRGRRYLTVFLDHSDEEHSLSGRPEFHRFDLVLKAHVNRHFRYPDNVKAWPYGLTGRLLTALAEPAPFESRARVLLVNYRLRDAVRQLADRALLPPLAHVLPVSSVMEAHDEQPASEYERFMWAQTGGRHDQRYFRRLLGSTACAAFVGRLWPPRPERWGARRRLHHRILDRIIPEPRRVVNWDSWRLWESLAAACVMVHLDFSQYRLDLPELPVNGTHYLGLTPATADDVAARIGADDSLLRTISAAGREWALAHYSPAATARRFLAYADAAR
jgi:hypothetical protein